MPRPKSDKPRKPRTVPDTEVLARWFVTEILHEEWDYRAHMRQLGEAKQLLHPTRPDAAPIPIDVVQGTIQCLDAKVFDYDGEIKTLWVITFGHPAFYKQYEEWSKTPPASDNRPEVAVWERITTEIAYPPEENRATLISVPEIPAQIPNTDYMDYLWTPSVAVSSPPSATDTQNNSSS